MRVLVTGAAGFIGSHVCDALLANGDMVVGIDNFDPFYPRRFKEDNLAAVGKRGNIAFVEGDIRNPADLDRTFSHGVDAVVHLAALAGVRPSVADPLRYQDVNVAGTNQVLEAMRRHGVTRLAFASSSSVYGNNGKVPFHEDDRVDNPISPYAATKRAGELIAHAYHHLFGFSVHCLRFFTVYGPRQRPDLAIRKFIGLMRGGEPIQVFGDGSFSRDFTYVGDIVKGVMASVRNLSGYRIYNLGGNRTVTVRRLIAILAEELKVEPTLEFLPAQPGDVERTFADIDRAGAELGYAPSTPIEVGVARMAEWLREYGERG